MAVPGRLIIVSAEFRAAYVIENPTAPARRGHVQPPDTIVTVMSASKCCSIESLARGVRASTLPQINTLPRRKLATASCEAASAGDGHRCKLQFRLSCRGDRRLEVLDIKNYRRWTGFAERRATSRSTAVGQLLLGVKFGDRCSRGRTIIGGF